MQIGCPTDASTGRVAEAEPRAPPEPPPGLMSALNQRSEDNPMKTSNPTTTGLLATISLSLALSACGGGGSVEPTPPAPPATRLNSDNAVDAAGVAGLALQRTQTDVAQLLGTVLGNYMQQTPAGSFPCSKGGSLTLSRPGPMLWNYSAENCDTGAVVLRTGTLQLDAGLPDGQGLRLDFKDLGYGASARPAEAAQLINGRFGFLINVNEDLGKRSAGSLEFTSNGRTDQYAEVYIANKTSDSNFLQYGVKLRSPRFPHELMLVLDQPSRTVTVRAEDGSVLTLVEQPGGAKLEVRAAAGGAPLLSRVLTTAELEAAMARAMR